MGGLSWEDFPGRQPQASPERRPRDPGAEVEKAREMQSTEACVCVRVQGMFENYGGWKAE